MTSLNDLVHKPEFKQKQAEKDLLFERISAYFLPHQAVKSSVKCYSATCKITASSGQLGDDQRSFLLCYACNSTVHVFCVGEKIDWTSEGVPWQCKICREKKSNQKAVKFYQSQEWKEGMKARRIILLKEEMIEADIELLIPKDPDESDVSFTNWKSEQSEDYLSSSNTNASNLQLQKQLEEYQKELQLSRTEIEALRKQNEMFLNQRQKLDASLAKNNLNTTSTFNSSSFMSSTQVPPSNADILKAVYTNLPSQNASFSVPIQSASENSQGGSTPPSQGQPPSGDQHTNQSSRSQNAESQNSNYAGQGSGHAEQATGGGGGDDPDESDSEDDDETRRRKRE
jgi:hypothetical protein